MHIKTTVRCHYTPSGMTENKKTDNITCWQRQGTVGTQSIACENIKWENHFGKSFGSFLKKGNTPLPCHPLILFPENLPGRDENMFKVCPQNGLYANG